VQYAVCDVQSVFCSLFCPVCSGLTSGPAVVGADRTSSDQSCGDRFWNRNHHGRTSMKFNKFQLGVLAIGLVAFLLLGPKTESAFVDMIVLADILGKLLGNRQ